MPSQFSRTLPRPASSPSTYSTSPSSSPTPFGISPPQNQEPEQGNPPPATPAPLSSASTLLTMCPLELFRYTPTFPLVPLTAPKRVHPLLLHADSHSVCVCQVFFKGRLSMFPFATLTSKVECLFLRSSFQCPFHPCSFSLSWSLPKLFSVIRLYSAS